MKEWKNKNLETHPTTSHCWIFGMLKFVLDEGETPTNFLRFCCCARPFLALWMWSLCDVLCISCVGATYYFPLSLMQCSHSHSLFLSRCSTDSLAVSVWLFGRLVYLLVILFYFRSFFPSFMAFSNNSGSVGKRCSFMVSVLHFFINCMCVFFRLRWELNANVNDILLYVIPGNNWHLKTLKHQTLFLNYFHTFSLSLSRSLSQTLENVLNFNKFNNSIS